MVGVTGSGKTTLADSLAARLGVPHVEMDALNWQRGWQPIERDEFRRRVDAATSAPGWVSDGNYREVRDLVWGRAQVLVWLDYPLALILWRLLCRSLRRISTREELWNGNRESVRGLFFSSASLFVYAVRSRPELRRNIASAAAHDYPYLTLVQLTGPRATRRWLAELDCRDESHDLEHRIAA
ncbi:adenylate kinase [bacterium]|nr:MAG: adenylate kinase [bacterium]